MACAIEESGVTFEAFFRSSLREALKRLRSGKKLRLWSGDGMPAQHTDLREDTLDGDAFRACEAEVVASYGSEAFIIAIYVYSDSVVLSWSGAHKLYPVRIRVVNVETDEYEWITVAYVPSVATKKGKGGAERSRCLRIAVMQRVLFLALRDLVEASHTGVQFVDADGRELLGFPRVLMYLCDQPEERAIPCLKPGQCAHPCSACMAPQASMASPAALTFKQRTLLNTLHKQLQAFGLLQQGRERQRRLQMEKAVSMNSYLPALAAMAGLTTAPFLLYKIIGFDVLHGKVADTASDVEVPDSTDADAGDSGTSGGQAQSFLQNILGEDGGGDDTPSAENDEPGRAAAKVGADKEDKKAAQSHARLDWAAYREAFPDTPPHAAITAMFAEYALLVGRITRKLGVATVTPMTMREEEELATQAQTFVLRYVTPILGPLHTTKVHKLLCHLLDAVRLHGNILNGDTSTNEQEHKEDKRYYPRTNKSSSGYMRQLVRHASGLRVISRRNKAVRAGQASGAATAASNADGYDADGESVEEDTDDGTGAVVVPSPAVYGRGGAAAASEGAELNPAAAADRQLGPVGAPLSAAAVADLAAQPGLGDTGPLLRLDSGDEVRVPSHLHFTARTPGRCDERYLVRASPNYRGAPWHDHVAYRSVDSLPSAPEHFGRGLAEAGGIKIRDIAKQLRLPLMKLHCSTIAEDAIRAAIKDVKGKQAAAETAKVAAA
ncbi:hypothetical protein I4F81_008221 [Pyropia yezoensis]|uniref:Uncharacterized protein n=1 Tax=Pyropia yezoensis TaxID=2788 RepID=A0ACC3C652_PYRYE|nr:hypothetical protein I4F81_008221 [Neopyropia yezoensis]